MINAKEAFLRSQSPEVLEKIRKEREAHLQWQLKEISDGIESAINRNATEIFYSRMIERDLQEVLESMGYTVTSTNGVYSKISWGSVNTEANDILKGIITDEPKKKWWQKWRKG